MFRRNITPLSARRRVKIAWIPACWLHPGFLLDLFSDPEDGGDMFLRIVCWLSPNYTALYLRRHNSLRTITVNIRDAYSYNTYFKSLDGRDWGCHLKETKVRLWAIAGSLRGFLLLFLPIICPLLHSRLSLSLGLNGTCANIDLQSHNKNRLISSKVNRGTGTWMWLCYVLLLHNIERRLKLVSVEYVRRNHKLMNLPEIRKFQKNWYDYLGQMVGDMHIL
jgi:hypothetical protein